MIGIVEEVGVSFKKVIVDLEFEEVFGRGFDCEDLREVRRLGVFGGKWVIVVVILVDFGKKNRESEFGI